MSFFDEGLDNPNLHEEIQRVIKEIIASRIVRKDKNSVETFLSPSYSQIANTYKCFVGIDDVISRIHRSIENNERITIHGDFDADGLTATAIMTEYLKSVNYTNYSVYIPDRLTTGHGITVDTVERLASENTKLIITVDCGVDAIEPVNKAVELDVDVIITDHHIAGDVLPNCLILVPPDALATPFSGAGIAFKLVQGLCGNGLDDNEFRSKLLQLAMLGTIVDSVPQVGENRTISKLGFDAVADNAFIGLSSIMTQNNLDIVRSEDITYTIAPRLSAASRLGEPLTAYKLLVTDDAVEAFHLQKKLTELNNTRKQLVKDLLAEIEVDTSKPAVTVIVDNKARGVTGLLASRLAEKYEKPAFVCAHGLDEYLHCSARSGGYCDLEQAFNFVRPVIESGGGHKHAGGAVLTEENYPDFRMKLNTFMNKFNKDDEPRRGVVKSIALKLSVVGKELLDEIRKFEPYGPSGLPVFHSFVVADNARLIGKTKDHLEMKVCCIDSKREIRAIGWNMAKLIYDITSRNPLNPFEIKYTIAENNFRKKISYELHLLEIDFHGTEIPF